VAVAEALGRGFDVVQEVLFLAPLVPKVGEGKDGAEEHGDGEGEDEGGVLGASGNHDDAFRGANRRVQRL